MTTLRHTLIALAVASTLALTGCDSGHEQPSTDTPATPGPATPAATGPLTADQVNVEMTLLGPPLLSMDGQSVSVTVNIANHGKTTLSSAGAEPVHLGAHSADAAGMIINRDLARANIPDIAPKGQATVTIQLPADELIGNNAEILPVQEGVAWFDTWGTKPLTVGPFSNCTSPATVKVCDAKGQPLATTH